MRHCQTEQTKKEKRQEEKSEGHLYVVIQLACERHFAEQLGEICYFDLADFDGVQHYEVHKRTPFEDFKEMVSRDFGIAKHLQRFWSWCPRQNGTTRIEKPLETESGEIKTVLDLKAFREKNIPLASQKTALMTVKLFLETPDVGDVLRPLQQTEFLIFIKHYDPKLRRLSYVGRLHIKKMMLIRAILEKAKKLAGLPQNADVIGFEEVKFYPHVTCPQLQPGDTAERVRCSSCSTGSHSSSNLSVNSSKVTSSSSRNASPSLRRPRRSIPIPPSRPFWSSFETADW